MNEGSQSSRSHSTSPLSSSFDDRLRKKLSSDRSSSNFESRLQKKLTNESQARLAQKLNGSSSSTTSDKESSTVQRKNSVENRPARDIETSKRFQAAYERARSLSKSREERPASRGNSEERFKAVYERARSMSKSRGERRDSGKSVTSSSNL